MKWSTMIKAFASVDNRGYYSALRKRANIILSLNSKNKNCDMADVVCAILLAVALTRIDFNFSAFSEEVKLCLSRYNIPSLEELDIITRRLMSNRGRPRKPRPRPALANTVGDTKPGGTDIWSPF